MQDAFGVVIFVVVGVSAVAAVIALAMTGRTYEDIGRGGLFDGGETGRPPVGPDGARDDEIRQMLAARNARRTARGEQPVDVERELGELTQPRADPELEAEVRALVESRNRRRASAGLAPLDVDAEVARRLAELG